MKKQLKTPTILGCALLAFALPAGAQTLTGAATSAEEGAMEGVVVSAKRAGSTIMLSVVSDAKGEFRFPDGKLEPGSYNVTIRAIGYDLKAPTKVELKSGAAEKVDLALVKTKRLASQLTNAEWYMSMPATEQQKKTIFRCIDCHTLQRPMFSTGDAEEMTKIVQRMSAHTSNAAPQHPFYLQDAEKIMAKPPTKEQEALGAFLASINLSGGETWNYELKKLPRPKGKSTRVLVTTYDLPRKDSAPHDTARDADGIVWYSDFQTAVIGRLDPKTGAVKEFPIPLQKPLDKGFPTGSLQIALDQGGNVYAGTMGQSQVVRFDPKTEKIQTWPSPLWDKGDARVTMIDPRFATVNGEIWVNEAGLPPGNIAHKLNINTGEWTRINRQPGGLPVYAYGLVASLKNNLYGLPLFTDDLYEVDAKTLQINHYRIPNAGAGGRRGHIDSKDRLWFAQFMGSSLAMFDPETKGFKTWKIPTPYYNPYDAQFDDKKFAWLSGMNTDSVLRFDVETGEWVEYLMPLTTNMRHIDVQKEGDVSSVWVQDEHNGKIVHVQPLGD